MTAQLPKGSRCAAAPVFKGIPALLRGNESSLLQSLLPKNRKCVRFLRSLKGRRKLYFLSLLLFALLLAANRSRLYQLAAAARIFLLKDVCGIGHAFLQKLQNASIFPALKCFEATKDAAGNIFTFWEDTMVSPEKTAPFSSERMEAVLKASLSELSLLMEKSDGNASFTDVNKLPSKRLSTTRGRKSTGKLTSAILVAREETFERLISSPSFASFGKLDGLFLRKCFLLCRLAIPTFFCRETVTVSLLMTALVARTFMSIWIASIHGSVVKGIVDRDFNFFLQSMWVLVLYSLPASFINAAIAFLSKQLALLFRQRLTNSFLRRYLQNKAFYQVTALDGRISHPDQRLTDDITKWADSLASIFSSITKPILDIFFLSQRLATYLGIGGPLMIMLWYCLSAVLQQYISPAFGQLAAEGQALEGDYRKAHSSIVDHAEEIAFYGGHMFELRHVLYMFSRVVSHSKRLLRKNLFMGCFDNLLVKFGAVIVGYVVLAIPVFSQKQNPTSENLSIDASQITLDYARNSSLLINLAKAIGRIVVSYKEIQVLAGLTSLICEMNDVFDNLDDGIVLSRDKQGLKHRVSISNVGHVHEAKYVELKDVPILTPGGETLINSISFSVPQGGNLFILGPNGCGKSSVFRVLGELWPLAGGDLYKPSQEQLFYIPQRPYMPNGTLRQQLIYPDSYEAFTRKGHNDKLLRELLEAVGLAYLEHRSDFGFDIKRSWEEELSGGEKQRLGVARLSYHQPVFAILDEATSAVSVDVESGLYEYLKKRGISLITISHRMHLLKHHDYILRFNGQGGCSFDLVKFDDSRRYQSFSNLLKIQGDFF